jgi:hypothetical protein
VPETVGPFQEWLNSLPPSVTELISPDFAPFRTVFDRKMRVLEQRSLAGAVGKVAASGLRLADPAVIDANYVRRSDAEMKWKDEPLAGTP